MRFPVYLLQALESNMRVNLRCRKITVPEHLADTVDIRTAVQQMSCKTVTQNMWIFLFLFRDENEILSGKPLDKHGVNFFSRFCHEHK